MISTSSIPGARFVDPKVLGGASVRIGHDLYDGTVSRRLNQTRAALAGKS